MSTDQTFEEWEIEGDKRKAKERRLACAKGFFKPIIDEALKHEPKLKET